MTNANCRLASPTRSRENHDSEAMLRADRLLAEAHTTPPTIPGDVFMFGKLSAPEQLAVLESASPDEAKKYMPHVRKDLRADSAF